VRRLAVNSSHTSHGFAKARSVYAAVIAAATTGVLVLGPAISADGPRPSPRLAAGALKAGPLTLESPFEENVGQFDPRVRFAARAGRATVFLTDNEAIVAATQDHGRRDAGSATIELLRLRVKGARSPLIADPANPQPGFINYFVGRSPRNWHRGVRTYGEVRYRDVYPGIDLVYHANEQSVEYDFRIAPGSDPSQIRILASGARRATIDRNGDLVFETGAGTVRQRRPFAFQEIGGTRKEVKARYRLVRTREDIEVAFVLGRYDKNIPLVIDPVLTYSTFLGGSDDPFGGQGARTFATAVATDSSGAVYVTGRTNALNFPGAPAGPANSHAFVSKLVPRGNGAADLAWTTILAGSMVQADTEAGTGIAVGPTGQVYVTGWTLSPDFPITPGAFQTTLGTIATTGDRNAFITQLNPVGGMVYSTYLGGTVRTMANALALDANQNVVVVGETFAGFPTTPDAYSVVNSGGADAFVSVLQPLGLGQADLIYSTHFGGSGAEVAMGIDTDGQGRLHVAGLSRSTNMPTTAGAAQTFFAGSQDVFYAVLNRSLPGPAGLHYATYLGGNGGDEARAVAVDAGGRGVIVGMTETLPGGTFPTTPGAYPPPANFFGGILAIIDPAGNGQADLQYSTVIGSSFLRAVAIDSTSRAWLGGTAFAGFPACSGTTTSDGGLVAIFNPQSRGSDDLTFATVVGGTSGEDGNGLALGVGGRDDIAALVGTTTSVNFPTTPGAFQSTYLPTGGAMAFVSIVDRGQLVPTSTTLTSSANPVGIGQPLILTATVTGATGGTVRFRDGATELGSSPVANGVATFTTSTLTGGVHSLTASYRGDCTLAPSESPALTQHVASASPTTTTLQAVPNPALIGQNVQLVATVVGQNPTGSVEFFDGAASLGSRPLNGGLADLTVSGLALGEHQISARYAGDNANDPSESAPVTVRITNPVDLSVAFVSPTELGRAGQPLVYTLVVVNVGGFPGTGVTLTQPLPASTTFVSATTTVGSCAATGTLRCDIGALDAGAQAVVTVTLNPTVSTSLTTTATVFGAEADPNPANNSATVTTLIDPVDMAITMTDSPDPVGTGQTVIYSLTIINFRNTTATGVTLENTLPAGATLVGIGGSTNGVCSGILGPVIRCFLPDIPPVTSVVVTLTMTVPGTAGTITNSARVSANEFDPNLANNSASESTTVVPIVGPPPSLTLAPIFTEGASYRIGAALAGGSFAPAFTEGTSYRIGTSGSSGGTLAPIYTEGASYRIVAGQASQ
jgi:uncharacterized repeat protein (TIGR01451 family)